MDTFDELFDRVEKLVYKIDEIEIEPQHECTFIENIDIGFVCIECGKVEQGLQQEFSHNESHHTKKHFWYNPDYQLRKYFVKKYPRLTHSLFHMLYQHFVLFQKTFHRMYPKRNNLPTFRFMVEAILYKHFKHDSRYQNITDVDKLPFLSKKTKKVRNMYKIYLAMI